MNEVVITLTVSDSAFGEIPFEAKSIPLSELIKIIGDRPISAIRKSVKREPIYSASNIPLAVLTGGGKIEFVG